MELKQSTHFLKKEICGVGSRHRSRLGGTWRGERGFLVGAKRKTPLLTGKPPFRACARRGRTRQVKEGPGSQRRKQTDTISSASRNN